PTNDDPTMFIEATFTGYVAKAVVLGAPQNLSTFGRGRKVTVTYNCTADLIAPQEVKGWYLVDNFGLAPTKVYAEGVLDLGIVMALAGDALQLTMLLPLRSEQDR